MTTRTLSPFVERNICTEHFAYHFERIIQGEMRLQQEQGCTGYQIDFNKLYAWTEKLSPRTYNILRHSVLDRTKVNAILSRDIAMGSVENILQLANEEYLHQKRQVKLGRRKRIQVDFNILYC